MRAPKNCFFNYVRKMCLNHQHANMPGGFGNIYLTFRNEFMQPWILLFLKTLIPKPLLFLKTLISKIQSPSKGWGKSLYHSIHIAFWKQYRAKHYTQKLWKDVGFSIYCNHSSLSWNRVMEILDKGNAVCGMKS